MPRSPSHLRNPAGSPLFGRLVAIEGTGRKLLCSSGFSPICTESHQACARAASPPASHAMAQAPIKPHDLHHPFTRRTPPCLRQWNMAARSPSAAISVEQYKLATRRLAACEHDLIRKPVPTFRDHALNRLEPPHHSTWMREEKIETGPRSAL